MADTEARLRITAENRTKQAFDEIKRSMSGLDGASNALRNTLGALGVGLSLGGIVAFAKSGIDAADNLSKLSQRVGVSVESLSAFNHAAKLADVSTEEFSVGLRQLAKNAADTQAGTGEAIEAFKALGLAVTDTGGNLKGTEELLLDISERFAGIENGAGKTALAMKIFGRSGATLIPLLNEGRAGFEALRREAEQLGLIVSTQTAKAAEQFSDDMERLGTAVDKVKFALAEGMLPALTKIGEAMAEATRRGGALQGIIAGIQTLLTGDDLHKANVEFVKLTDQLLDLENARSRAAASSFPGQLDALDARIAKVKERLSEVQRYRDLLEGGVSPKSPQDGPKKAAPALSSREGDSVFQNTIKQLEQEALKVQDLTRFEETLAGIEAGRYGKLATAQKDRLLQLAAAIDLGKIDAQTQKEVQAAIDAAGKAQDARALAEAEHLTAIASKTRDIVDPTRAWRREVDEMVKAYERGLISIEELNRAAVSPELRELLTPKKTSFDLLNEALKEGDISLQQYKYAVDRINEGLNKTKDDAKEIGLIFESAASDAIRNWQGVGNLIKNIALDIAQIAVKKTIIDPIGAGVTGLFNGIDFGGIFGGANDGNPTGALLGSFATGTDFVPRTGPYLLHQGEKVVPAAENTGGGTYYIDARGADPAGLARLESTIRQLNGSIERRAVAAVADARLRGGAFAASFGR